MDDKTTSSGRCLCGAVKIQAKISQQVGACHCGMCRRWVGGPLMTVDCGTDVAIEGRNHVAEYQSSEWAKRGFCKTCGSALYYYLKPGGQYTIPVGLFSNLEGLNFDHQIYIDNKPDLYSFANETKNLTEAEVIALYTPDA